MYILDKNKDFYDYIASFYGVDKTITFDRRGSIKLDDASLFNHIKVSQYDDKHFFVVEIGNVQYLFSFENIVYTKVDKVLKNTLEFIKGDIILLKVFEDNKNYFGKEITILPVRVPCIYIFKKNKYIEKVSTFSDLRYDREKCIHNSILGNTSLTKYLDAKEVWKNLSNFISAKYNDKTVTIENSDIDKIVNHGFDKVTSFRNPVK